ncbi:MAG: hypothetical protein R3B89_21125 [Polyangiaceae bacterium]
MLALRGGGFGWEISDPNGPTRRADLPERYHSIRLAGVLGVGAGGGGGLPNGNGGGAGPSTGGSTPQRRVTPVILQGCAFSANEPSGQSTSWLSLLSLLGWG